MSILFYVHMKGYFMGWGRVSGLLLITEAENKQTRNFQCMNLSLFSATFKATIMLSGKASGYVR